MNPQQSRCRPGSKPATSPKRRGLCVVVWTAICELERATCGEIAAALQKPKKNIAPRLTDLEILGQIEDSGDRRGGGRRGPLETVWRIVDKDGAMTKAEGQRPNQPGLFAEYGLI